MNGLATNPAPLNMDSALRQAATAYDDGAVNRILNCAARIAAELAQMQSETRARGARQLAIRRIYTRDGCPASILDEVEKLMGGTG